MVANNLDDAEFGETVLPHMVFNAEELNLKYPSYTAAEEAINEDHDEDLKDPLYRNGLKVAKQITDDMRQYGRVRNVPGQ